MPNVRDYLRKKAERKEKKPNTHNFGDLILKHRMAIITRTLLVLLLCAGLGATIYVQLKNQVFSSYITLSSIEKQQYDSAASTMSMVFLPTARMVSVIPTSKEMPFGIRPMKCRILW